MSAAAESEMVLKMEGDERSIPAIADNFKIKDLSLLKMCSFPQRGHMTNRWTDTSVEHWGLEQREPDQQLNSAF